MIKAGIIGGDLCITGDLIRLLLHHPDVELMWVADSRLAGQRIDVAFPDLIGDIDMTFSSTPDYTKLDAVFVLGCAGGFAGALENPELRVITIGEAPEEDFIHGVPELNRKAMVRGGRRVTVPPATEGLIELALLPLAKNLMLNKAIHVAVVDPSEGESSVSLESSTEGAPLTQRIGDTLRELQSSFNSTIEVVTVREPSQKGILASIYFDCAVETEELVRIYNDFFEDHRFTFVVKGTVSTSSVLRTNKCMIGLKKTGNKLLVTAAIDERLKGCAGTAVHSMNLLFGLHERTGF